MILQDQIDDIIDSSINLLLDIPPSAWAESNRIMTTDVSPLPGRFSYEKTPYMREIVDCFSRFHPARIVALRKGAQIGATAGVIENAIGWIMATNPGNILFITGHQDLADEAVIRIDQMIDSCGLRKLIRPNVIKDKNSRTGDTTKMKEFPGGNLVAGGPNDRLMRQRSVRFGIFDDFDAAKSATKKAGNIRKLYEQRFAAYWDKAKILYSSTPELLHLSNIQPAYLLGDQRKYFLPCPCCGAMIELCWETHFRNKESKDKAGITWKTDDHGQLIVDSVGYICQECGDFFDDSYKTEMNLAGEWRPTAKPSEVGYYSYHISSLYAPLGMKNWEAYVRQYLEANPPGEKQDPELMQTFVNLALGEPFEQTGEAPKANDLQKNIRNYPVGIIPEALSIKDGNGKIVLLTCACDLNGTEHDARLDYEVVAWSESGSSYSVKHGSIGTFIPMEGSKKVKEDRERFSYDKSRPNNVWKHLDTELSTIYSTDTGRRMQIFITGIDCGHYSIYAYAYLDKTNFTCFGLKGKDVEKNFKLGREFPAFHISKERENLYLVEVNRIKDDLAERIKLKWDQGNDPQPSAFMNFPNPSDGLYGFKNYFEHFEAEHRVLETKEGSPIAARWVKKNSAAQNHFWDVHVYNMAMKDILVGIVKKDLPKKDKPIDFGWKEVVKMMLGEKI